MQAPSSTGMSETVMSAAFTFPEQLHGMHSSVCAAQLGCSTSQQQLHVTHRCTGPLGLKSCARDTCVLDEAAAEEEVERGMCRPNSRLMASNLPCDSNSIESCVGLSTWWGGDCTCNRSLVQRSTHDTVLGGKVVSEAHMSL